MRSKSRSVSESWVRGAVLKPLLSQQPAALSFVVARPLTPRDAVKHMQRALGETMQLRIVHPRKPEPRSAQSPAELMHHDPIAKALQAVTRPLQPDEAERLRLIALSRSDNQGGAGPDTVPADAAVGNAPVDAPISAAIEAVQLRIRVIALENLVIALLAQEPAAQLELVREMAAHISPRPGFTPHHLTLLAADEMRSLVDRASPFRAPPAA